ncbi:MAG TPA: NfeD family protein [Anaeromyxobacteraceae bacterium]|nr:NfeD family protein [Anaeromyxobacteraceae bacterium]
MSWWAWILFGLALLVVEMITPGGLFALFFGLGALAVGLLVLAGASGPAWLQWFVFAGVSLALLAAMRSRLKKVLNRGRTDVDSIVGEVAVPVSALEPQGFGKAELRGSVWQAHNIATVRLEAGQRCRVERVDGLMLLIGP